MDVCFVLPAAKCMTSWELNLANRNELPSNLFMWQPGHKIKTHKCRFCLISKSGCCGQMFETLRWLRSIRCMVFCLESHAGDSAVSAFLVYCPGDDMYNFIITFLLVAQTVSSVMTTQPNHAECGGALLSVISAALCQITWETIATFTLFCISFSFIQLKVTDPKRSVFLFGTACPAVSSLCSFVCVWKVVGQDFCRKHFRDHFIWICLPHCGFSWLCCSFRS